jgi:disulfide bond formation protein DsbB
LSRGVFSHIGPVTLIARHWPLVAFLACALALGAAHAFETFGHLAPCELCLKQREVYWAALTIAAVSWASRLTPLKLGRWVCAALGLAFACGAALALYHAGVEWKFWPGPASCSGGQGAVNAADLTRLLQGGAMRPPSCDKAAWVFLGLSMAGWNAIVSMGLAAASLYSARATDR